MKTVAFKIPAKVADAANAWVQPLDAAADREVPRTESMKCIASDAPVSLQAHARVQSTRDALRQAMTATATAATLGVLEVNLKVIDALFAQSDAAVELWSSALATRLRAQASAARHIYDAAATWMDVATNTTRRFGGTVKPILPTWTDQFGNNARIESQR